ncbi:hypothetical protein [Polaribacter aestuariivivens]|uniref:hypothetical protein n=1 Tax=Polaribacter aestuariivivens TaxID=2304626 RepID=UPI003F491393
MKLITKNLTGYLENGDRYKICFDNKKCDVLKHKRIISVSQYSFNEYVNTWVLERVVCSYYQFREDYTNALKEALIKAESEFNIDLLKSEMKIAV